jgi:hypothetical protein
MKKKITGFGIAGLLALTLSGCAAGPTKLETVYETCGLSQGSNIADEGKTLIVDMMGEEDYVGASYSDVSCVVNDADLAMPDYIVSAIETTRALDGRQSGDWESFEAQWSYHPDSGLDLVIYQK